MARYTGPRTKKSRTFGEPIFGYDKAFEKRKYAPGQHGNSRKKGTKSEYAVQLKEKQKAKLVGTARLFLKIPLARYKRPSLELISS